MKTRTKQEIMTNHNTYHVQGLGNHHKVKKNAIFVSNANSIKHELAKAIGAIMVKRYGDLKFDRALILYINDISHYMELVLLKDWELNESEFLTEAVPNDELSRRIDLVNLANNDRYEFETQHNIKKDNCVTVYI